MLRRPIQPVLFVGAGHNGLVCAAYLAAAGHRVTMLERRDVVGEEVLALVPPQVRRIDVGKEGFGHSTSQDAINDTLVAEALAGWRVVRLKGGDGGIYGRLDEEIEALEVAGIGFAILPGLTSATVAAARIGQSLTRRGRNSSLRILTGHDMAGFAEQDWRGLARKGEVAAIYMGRKSSRFVQGRLMMHGAASDTPVTLVENVSRADERVLPATLATLAETAARTEGPVVILFGLAPREAASALSAFKEARA